MADIGAIGEIVNASEAHLVVGADTYILLQDLHIHIGRPEFRDPSTGAGAVYSYGKGEHFMEFTLIATTPELDTLAALNDIDSNGAMTSTSWTIVATDISGSAKTFTCTGVANPLDISKGAEGKLKIDVFVRITPDTVVVA
jgi:hypothetical protein